MYYPSSTMNVAVKCCGCGKWCKESEAHFYGNMCTECKHQEFLKYYVNTEDECNQK